MKKFLFLIGILFFFNTSKADSKSEATLGSLIKQTRQMYQSGVDRKKIADFITKEVDKKIMCTNNSELFDSPLNWFRLLKVRTLTSDLESGSYRDVANVAWTNGLGNCEENSTIVYYILKNAGVKEHVRILRSGSHSFTVWDVHPSADINDPLSWGENALVVDPWLGNVISKEEAQGHKYFKNNDPDVTLTDFTTYSDEEAQSWSAINTRYNREHNIKPSQTESNKKTDCFLATAVYGTPQAPEIQVLRTYRDEVLREKWTGRLFIATYERFSPVFAFYIRDHVTGKSWVRNHIVEPSVHYADKQLKNQDQ